jgi:predicted TPR repeat methyltransferase
MERRVAEVFGAEDREELTRAYARWAERYDEDMLSLEMRGPEIVAAMAGRYVRDRASPILDAGAGTGRVGELLAILGYSNLVALDLSDAMLAQAQERGVYRALRQGALGDQLPFADDAFGAVVAAGVFTAGHAPPSGFDELLRVTRSAGLTIFTLATPAYETGGFKDKLETLKREGRWRLLEATAPFHGLRRSVAYRDHTGLVLAYEVAG